MPATAHGWRVTSRTLTCRGCGGAELQLVVDLGPQPPAEQFLDRIDSSRPDPALPLRVLVCTVCWLVQLEGPPIPADDEPGGLAFSVSATMRDHTEELVDDALARVPHRADLSIVEVASHGNRLNHLFRRRGLDSLLVEAVPAYARAASEAGIRTVNARLTEATAHQMIESGQRSDLIIDAFYLAHDPAPREYLAGVADLLASDGRAVFEFDHVLPTVVETQFDGFRHGHASYLSLAAFNRMIAEHGLVTVDAAPTPVYGGSLRVVVAHEGRSEAGGGSMGIEASEVAAGLLRLETYERFAQRVDHARGELRTFLDEARTSGRSVAGYGAPSRGNTLLNSTGVTSKDIAFTVDQSTTKQGRFLPGSRIPILPPARLAETRPDYVLILTWDLKEEVMRTMAHVRNWGGRFVVPLPALSVLG